MRFTTLYRGLCQTAPRSSQFYEKVQYGTISSKFLTKIFSNILLPRREPVRRLNFVKTKHAHKLYFKYPKARKGHESPSKCLYGMMG